MEQALRQFLNKHQLLRLQDSILSCWILSDGEIKQRRVFGGTLSALIHSTKVATNHPLTLTILSITTTIQSSFGTSTTCKASVTPATRGKPEASITGAGRTGQTSRR
jgi:hypothetical protein